MAEKASHEKWNLIGRGVELTDDELFGRLLNSERKIVVLDGYSGCGKTTLIRRLSRQPQREVFTFTDEKMGEIIVREVMSKQYNPSHLLELSEKEAVICIEDIDLARSKSATLTEIELRVKRAVQRHLVIITGNDLCEKMQKFLADLGGEVWKKYRP